MTELLSDLRRVGRSLGVTNRELPNLRPKPGRFVARLWPANHLARLLATAVLLILLAAIAYAVILLTERPVRFHSRLSGTLARLTFDAGLQNEPTWSPDGRFIAYSSDKSGNFDIWVQPLAGATRYR